MQKTITLCDICGQQNALSIQVKVGRSMDAAGSMETDYEVVDLCHKHASSLLERTVEKSGGYDMARELVADVKRRHAPPPNPPPNPR